VTGCWLLVGTEADFKSFLKKRQTKIDIDALRKFNSIQAHKGVESKVREIKRRTKKKYSPEEKIRILLLRNN
ncbi:MAG: hypothetical protein KAJ50_00665, partial [Bacteroidales bacterium]|nr:hypothetical protein [Bacteroidales bacterium]